MIYSMPINNFPKEGQYHNCYSHNDMNRQEWKIAIVENGFVLAYFGKDYLKQNSLLILFEGEPESKLINNTGCFFWQTKDLDVYSSIRETIIHGFTDDVYCMIRDCISERLLNDPGLVECEIIK